MSHRLDEQCRGVISARSKCKIRNVKRWSDDNRPFGSFHRELHKIAILARSGRLRELIRHRHHLCLFKRAAIYYSARHRRMNLEYHLREGQSVLPILSLSRLLLTRTGKL